MQKGFTLPFLILIIVGVIAAAGAAYYFGFDKAKEKSVKGSPSPTVSESTSSADTSNWKVYTDQDSGISFRYPAYYTAQKLSGDLHYDGNIELFHHLSLLMRISYVNNPQKLSLQELDKKLVVHTDVSGDVSPNFSSPDNQPVAIGEYQGYFNDKYFCEPSVCKRYILTTEDKVFSIILYPTNSTDTHSDIQQILSTLKFTP